MAAGARSRGDAREVAPEKLQGLAEERFLAGDVAGALRAAREARARCRTPLPSSLAHALAAYEVHAAAASSSTGRNWYGVLGLGAGGTVTREDIKRRYRRLCLVLHPDKNRSAAADGAFKLLQEAWAVLSARHPPPPPSAEQKSSQPPQAAAAPKEAEKSHPDQQAASDKSYSYDRKPQWKAPASVYCGRCDRKYHAPDENEVEYCVQCHERLRNPRRSFLCPGTCPVPRCGGQFVPCMVAVEKWKLRCKLCRHESGGPPISREDLFHEIIII